MSLETLMFRSTPMWTSLLVLFLSFPLLWMLLRKQKQVANKPPSPPKLPILGNLLQLGALPHQSLAKLAEKHGPVMLLHLGFQPTIVISSAVAAKEALKTRDSDFSSRPQLFCTGKLSYDSSGMAFAPYSEYWRQMRKTCALELFSLKRVQSFQPVRVEEVNAMTESLAISATKGEAVDLGERLFALTGSIFFKVAFGTSFKGSMMDEKGFEKLIHEAEGLLGTFSFADFFPYVGWMVDKLSGLHSRIDRTVKRLDRFLEQVIDEHLNSPKAENDHHEDIVDVFLRIQREHVESGATWFTKNHIKGTLLNLFLAGVDTAALTVIWAMAELIKNPIVMKKVQDEIRDLMAGKDTVAERDIESLKYLKMVLKETLRLHPPVPLLLPKATTANTEVLGYPIKAGTVVYSNAWAIGRDPHTWDQPEEFIPERFENEDPLDYKGQSFESLPFGAGRRMCPGINMGMATVELALANLLHRFDWNLPYGMKKEELSMEEGPGLTTFMKVPLKLVPVNSLAQ